MPDILCTSAYNLQRVYGRLVGPFAVGSLEVEPPPGVPFADVSDVAVDSADNVYLLTRNQGAVVVYGADGRYIRSWGIDRFVLPHAITIDGDDRVYVVDQ